MKGREVQTRRCLGERRWYGKPGKHYRKEKNAMNKGSCLTYGPH